MDIVLANIPKSNHDGPYPAPYILKKCLQKEGYTCKVYDWNRELYEVIENKELFSVHDISFRVESELNKIWDSQIKPVAMKWINELILINPKWFGISLLSYNHKQMARKFLKLVRDHLPNMKIVVGGNLVIEGEGRYLKARGLIDHYISGSGEIALVELLKGNTSYPGIDSLNHKLVDINYCGMINYDDIEISNYCHFFTWFTKGCLNNCGFCSETFYKKIFQCRDPEIVIEEMNYIHSKFEIYHFTFADSLLNGHRKNFLHFIDKMKNCNMNWQGNFLLTDWMGEEEYKNAAAAGMGTISLGIETGVDRIRKEMGKSFTNKNIIQVLHWTRKYNIHVIPLMIVGWPTETEEDFQETLDFIEKISKFENLAEIAAGPTLQLSEAMPATDEYKVKFDNDGNWYNELSDFKLRQERWNLFVEQCRRVGNHPNVQHEKRIFYKGQN